MPDAIEEKRRFPRFNARTPLHFQIRGTPEFDNTISDNISAGGIGLSNNKFIAPETMIMLEVNILSRVLRAIGRIAWSSPLPHSNRYRMGIEFLEIARDESSFLQDYITMQSGGL